MERAARARELLDGPVSPADRAASLADIERLNAWFGGYALTLAEIRRTARAAPAGQPLVMLDVGGGQAGLAVRVARWARRARRRTTIVVVERDPETLGLARRAAAAYPEIRLVQADATALPFREAGADVVTAGLTLHHLEPDDAVTGLREMAAAARGVLVVNDLLRTRTTLALVWLVTRLLRCHAVSRHDGPLSVRRAYSASELGVLAEKAGVPRLSIRERPWLGRLLGVARWS